MAVALSSNASDANASAWYSGTFTSAYGDGVFYSTDDYNDNAVPGEWEWVRPDDNLMETGKTYRVRVKVTDEVGRWGVYDSTFAYDAIGYDNDACAEPVYEHCYRAERHFGRHWRGGCVYGGGVDPEAGHCVLL